jgi:hypothetical protein
MTQPADEVRQLLVHPAVWPHLEQWLAARNITLSRQQFSEDDLPTYVMTIQPAAELTVCRGYPDTGHPTDPAHTLTR